jgi:beta-N-acetylhexosaminidase
MLAVGVLVTLLAGCTAAPEPAETFAPAPPPAPVDTLRQYVSDRLGTMSLEERIASMVMVHVPGTDAATLDTVASENRLGGLILMGDNIPDDPAALAALTKVASGGADLPLLIATDQEGGVVRRVPGDDFPAAEQLRVEPPDAAYAAFELRGRLLQRAGITVNFGVVADVTADPTSFIFDRSLGGTPEDAAARVAEAVAGERGEVLTTLKHFPGHGVAAADSHTSIPTTGMSLEDWRSGHELPFAAGIEAGAEIVMFGHLQFDAVDPVPATLSARWHELLRDELGFDGIIITDDLSMLEDSDRPELADQAVNAVAAVAAGNTMLLYVQEVDIPRVVGAVRDAVIEGQIPLETINAAASRLLETRRALSGQTGPFVHCDADCQSRMD